MNEFVPIIYLSFHIDQIMRELFFLIEGVGGGGGGVKTRFYRQIIHIET